MLDDRNEAGDDGSERNAQSCTDKGTQAMKVSSLAIPKIRRIYIPVLWRSTIIGSLNLTKTPS